MEDIVDDLQNWGGWLKTMRKVMVFERELIKLGRGLLICLNRVRVRA